MSPTVPTRAATLAILVLATSLVPLAAAGPSASTTHALQALFVGDLLVDATGRVTGQNLNVVSLNEAQGTLAGFSSHGKAVFSNLAIDGFAGAQKLRGVGSPTLTLSGAAASLTLHDDVHSAISIATTAATTIRYDLAPRVEAAQRTAGIVDLIGVGSAPVGSIVIVGADAPTSLGDSLSIVDGQVRASAKSGSRVLFLATSHASSFDSISMHRAVVDAASRGELVSSFVTELHGTQVATTQLDAAHGAFARSTANSFVETLVSSPDAASAILSYDLAYETLPVHSARDIAVYVDGSLAARAQSAQDVRVLAAQGVASYYAILTDGARAQVLVSTSDFLSASEHAVSIRASHALTEAQARADALTGWARAFGGLSLGANGKLTGSFLTTTLAQGDAFLADYTSLAPRAEIFSTLKVADNKMGSVLTLDETHVRVSGSKADLTLVDDAYGTILMDAKDATKATFTLAAGVRATRDLSDLVTLTTSRGEALGTLLVVDSDAARKVSSSLSVNGGDVNAQLAKGARVVYRAASSGFQSESTITQAIAQGRVGAQILAGAQAYGIAATHTEYLTGVLSQASPSGVGALAVEYASKVEGAKAFVVDARGSAIAVKSASDVLVLIDGKPALPVSNAESALALGQQARFFAETKADGALRVIVNPALAAGETAHAVISSRLSHAAADAQFGAFKVFDDGTAVGSFVKLRADRAAGAVSGFGLLAQRHAIFDTLTLGASSFSTGAADGVGTLALDSKDASIRIADAADGLTRLTAKADANAAFQLAAGVAPDLNAAGNILTLRDEATGDRLGSLILAGKGTFRVAGDQVAARLAVGEQLVFTAAGGLEGEFTNAQRTLLDQAMASGALAGQVLVQTQGVTEGHLESSSRLAGDLVGSMTTSAVSSLGDVQMVVAATKDRVDITISSASKVGKTILVKLDANSVSGLATGKASILFDGVPVSQASSLTDVLNANDDVGVSEYFVLAGQAGNTVLVSVPHFSVHTVTLESGARAAGTGGPSIYLIASVFLGLLAAGEAALLVRRKKN